MQDNDAIEHAIDIIVSNSRHLKPFQVNILMKALGNSAASATNDIRNPNIILAHKALAQILRADVVPSIAIIKKQGHYKLLVEYTAALDSILKLKDPSLRYRWYYLATQMLIRLVREWGVPATAATVLRQVKHIRPAIEAELPGYLESGIMEVVLRNMQQLPKDS